MIQKYKNLFLKVVIIWILFFAVLFFVAPVLAQAPALDTGLDYAKATGLVDTDIRIIIARIVNVALGLLGIVALALVIYGGWMYMTAAGNEEQITKAKKILLDAGIGLAIILSAFAITQFVISKLTDAIMSQYKEDQQPPLTCTETGCPSGLQNLFYSASAPQGKLTIKNVTVSIVFMGNWGFAAEYDKETVPPIKPENIKIVKKTDQTSAPGDFSLKNASQIDFNPTGSCADASNPVNSDASNICFEKNTTYQVILNTSIKSINGLFLECSTAHPCVGEFITGEKMDITPPAISLNLPGQNALLPVDSKVEVSANYSDDAGVKMVSFQQDGKKIQDKIINPPEIQGIISTLWNTGIKAPAIYNLTAIAADVDNHETTSAAQTVKILPAYCFDTIKTENTDEIGVDCGPTCGACAGSNCQAALDCAKGFTCNASNICVKQTKVTNIEPKDGAIGNYVTIWGENFGVYDAVKSKVKFLGNAAGQEKEGKILSCDNKYTWKDNFIVVEVPVGAQNGPLQVFTATSTPDPFFQDRTDDKIGPYFDPANVFTVNDKIKPGLGCLKPVQGKPKESVQAEGINFGGTQGTSQFLFGIAPAAPVSWSPAFLNAAVPELPAQDLSVTVKVGDKISNPLPFKISEGVKVFPHISSLDPEEGPADSYVTISGNDFGSQTGKVIFYEDNNPFTADLADCSKNWSDTQIIAKVPFKMKNYSDKVKATVQVVTYENLKSNMQVFTVDNSKIKGPQLCSITPNNGPIDTLIKLTGSFGWDLGKIEYWKSITSTIYTDGGESWQDKEIADKVEKGAKTGSVKVWSDKLKAYSNHAVFKVQNCQEELKKGEALEKVCGLDNKCCGAGSCVPKNDLCPGEAGLKASIYAWSFTTGQMPLVPEMVKECQPGKVPSPSPGFNADKNLQPPPTNVCVNAIIKTQFTTLVKNVDSSFIVEKCIDAVCSSASKVDGKLDLTLVDGNIGETGNDMATFAPSNMWTPDTWYRVTLTTDIQSDAENSANMSPASEGQCVNPPNKIASDCFSFKTKNSLELCKLGSAVVSPNPFTAKQYDALYYPGDKTLYNVSAIAKDNVCWAIDANAYDWKWNAGKSAGINIVSDYATISNDQASGGVETVATALKSSVNFSNLSKEFKQDVQTMFNLAKHLIMKDKQYVLATFETPDAIVAIDITDSAKPTAAGQFEFKDKSISSLAVSGDFAYVLTNPKNLSVLNITDLKNIKLTATVANDPSKIDLNSAIDLVAKNQFVILSDNVSHRLRVLNVSNLQNIVSVGSLQNGESGAKLYGANKMFLIGNYLYVLAKDGAEGSFGIEVVDVSQVPKLSPVKFIPLQSNAQLLFANSQHLFASFDEGGLLGKRSIAIFDASKGFSSAGILSAPYTNGIYASDKYLFLSFKDASNEYVKVYDISDSTKPITVGTLKDENLKNPAVINGTNNQALIVSNPSGFVYLFNVVGLDVTSNILKGKPEQDLTTKDKETQPKESVWAQTGSGNNSVEDWAELSVSVNKPKVIDKWPDCPSACINAGIGALFSQDLDDASIKAPAITLCSVPAFNGSCQTFLTVNPVKIATSTIDLQYSGVLSPNQYYRVIIQGGENGVKGKSVAILDPEFLNYQCDGEEKNCQSFSWTFRTKNETDVCDIKTVKVMPSSVIVNWIGDNASYFSQAEGAPSQCNAFGEKLNSWVYNWNWTSKETKVATVNNFDITVGAALGCSTACAHLGSSPAPTGGYCGNDIVDIGEQCDPPDPFGNVCNSKCLNVNNVNKGTLPCVDVSKQNCCGNGGPFAKAEQDEDCDLGLEKNGQPGSGCTGNCLFSGTPVSFDICVNNLKMSEAKCSEVGAIAVCGNGEIEPGEDCDGSDNCGKNCLWKNKKENFNSLYCGNGVVDKGEDCDFVGVGDGKIDPWQFATAVGKGTVTNGQQKTEIMAIAKEKSGAADFILQCGFSPVDAKCPVGVMTDYFGIGKNSCCYARPTVKLIQPSTPPVPTNVCTNTAMTLKFSEVMDIGTFNSSTLGYFNIILAESTSTPNCPSGTFQVAQEIEKTQGWWNKIMVWFKKLLGQPAKANIYCAGGVDYTLISTTINDGTEENSALKTQVSLDLKNPLAGLTDYKIIVTKDVKSAAGLSLLMPYGAGPQIPPYSVSFKTQKDLCKIDNIKIDPEVKMM
ncbi:MAG: IPT/TIG domain-containing protein [Candidatus Magasanikbacteria bacterium]|nr:IPT/TIG domain-containing protein [Candidatus Magasanikbacteria bacterium]